MLFGNVKTLSLNSSDLKEWLCFNETRRGETLNWGRQFLYKDTPCPVFILLAGTSLKTGQGGMT
jgi:hypothetical protein